MAEPSLPLVPPVVQKQCSKCGQTLPLSEFSPDRRMNLGVTSSCKPCNRERMRRNKDADREKRRAYNRCYRAARKKELADKHRAWREANKEKIKAKQKVKYRANREAIIAYQVKYRKEQKAKLTASQRNYYQNHKKEIVERNRKWRRQNPDKLLAQLKHRRAMKMGAKSGGLTAAQWRTIKAAFGHRCAYCGCEPEKLTQDHYIPLSKGGEHKAGNVVPACLSCNCKKWANKKDVLPEFRSLVNG